VKEKKYKIQTKSKVQSKRGSTKDSRKGKVESEGMRYIPASRDGRTLKKRNGRKESDEETKRKRECEEVEEEGRIRESGYGP